MTHAFLLQAGSWSGALSRLSDLGAGAQQGAVDAAIALVAVLGGWLVAALLSRLVRAVLRRLRFDEGVERLLGGRAVARHGPSALAAWAVYWIVLAAAALLALETLGYHLGLSVAERLGDVLPRIVTATVLLVIGTLFALLVGAIVQRFLDSGEMRGARLVGQVLSALLTGFAALLALDQLGFAAQFVMGLGIVAAATAGLGLALAFGLGCRELARDFVIEYLRSLDEDRPRRPE